MNKPQGSRILGVVDEPLEQGPDSSERLRVGAEDKKLLRIRVELDPVGQLGSTFIDQDTGQGRPIVTTSLGTFISPGREDLLQTGAGLDRQAPLIITSLGIRLRQSMAVMKQNHFWFRGVGGARSRSRMFGR